MNIIRKGKKNLAKITLKNVTFDNSLFELKKKKPIIKKKSCPLKKASIQINNIEVMIFKYCKFKKNFHFL
jgi:hypothetical protein